MLRQHRAAHNALTVFCASIPMTLRGASLSHVEPVSIYCCEPDVVDFVAATGSQDIAAHLIPALQKAGRRVGVVTLRGETREICNWPSYLSVVGQALKSETPNVGGAYEQIAPGVWRHPEADVSANARIVGPVLIDRGCRIEPGAVVVGPTILGPGCVVEAQARIVRTVALGETIFPIRPVVSDRLIMHDTSAVDESSIAEHGRNAAGTPEVTVPAGPASRHGVWITVLVAVLVLAWALSGNAANVWHAWSQSGSLTVG